MVASRQVETPFYRSTSPQRGPRFGALAQVFGRTTILFLPKLIVPAAKCVGADLLESPAPEIVGVLSVEKKIKTEAKSPGRQTLS